MPEHRTEVEKEELGLYQDHKASRLDKIGRIAWAITFTALITMIIIQLNK